MEQKKENFPWLILVLMSSVTFMGILSELVPSGILPEMSEGLDVSYSSIGLLVSVYAIASHRDQANKLIGTFFWGKLVALALMIYIAFASKRKELYYYQNLGLSKQKLALTISLFDFGLWLILIVIAYSLVKI